MRFFAFAVLFVLAPTMARADDCGLAEQYRALADRNITSDADIQKLISDFAVVNAIPSSLTSNYRIPGTAMSNQLDRAEYLKRTARDRASALCRN